MRGRERTSGRTSWLCPSWRSRARARRKQPCWTIGPRTYLRTRMAFELSERASGVLLHPSSLPGRGGLGPEAHAFAGGLQGARQRWWQMLPVGPVGYGNSPYSALSAFAGNPSLVDPDHDEPARDELESFSAANAHWLAHYVLYPPPK